MRVELPGTIEECHELIGNLLTMTEKMQAEAEKMQAEIAELKARLNQNSQNSSRPPSSDGFRKPQVALPKKKGRRGGQSGHSGNTLKRVAAPDRVVNCEPLSCVCGQPEWTSEAEVRETRQVFELPVPRLEVIEYRRVERQCQCGWRVSGKFPEQVTGPVQYGERVQAMVTLLSVHGCLSYGKISQLFEDLYGYGINTATAQTMVTRSAERMPMEIIKAGVAKAQVAFFDESGFRENGRLKWMHTASTAQLTYQYPHDKRGQEAMTDEKSVLPDFRGVAVHDCLAVYFKFTKVQHALCGAHLLRELMGIIENDEAVWGAQMKELLLEMYRASDHGRGVIENLGEYEKRYEEILAAAESEEPPPERRHQKGPLKRTKGRNLLERLKKHREAVLRFAKEEAVPFTNNQAERDIRPLKVKQKMSGGFRAAGGSENYSRIQSFISTLRKQKRQVFEELLSVIVGNPFDLYYS